MNQYLYTCYNKDCQFDTNHQKHYENHCITQHKGKPAFPGIADIELYGWTAQNKDWENPPSKKEDIQNYVDRGVKK